MAYSRLFKNLVFFLVVLATFLSLIGGSEARPLPCVECIDHSTAKMFEEFKTMLPKGDPVPPSGPSSRIN
ncbi:hypothetical protein Acr_00g0072460 [Actinidia rufa]|uniref:Transmembrane protein n=1 Tax=Actinidia rufa TaxID=165716 RepID=A0A7J0DS15_9ERIC|nr:hypothetical protein Acr_00g0072460 [Actinidia rufa]